MTLVIFIVERQEKHFLPFHKHSLEFRVAVFSLVPLSYGSTIMDVGILEMGRFIQVESSFWELFKKFCSLSVF